MKDHKNDLSVMSARQLLARRRCALAPATRLGGGSAGRDAGGADAPVRQGLLLGAPAANRTARMRTSRRARRAAGGPGTCRRGWWYGVGRGPQRGEQVETVLAEISAINAELLARRVLG